MPELMGNPLKVADSRYFVEGVETKWSELAIRVGSSIAMAESSEINRKKYSDIFTESIFNLEFIPGGRILRNAGRIKGSLFNCYVLPFGDSREEIGKYFSDSFCLWGSGGGIGTNLSSLRPEGAPIRGVGGKSSGPISFLKASDFIAETIQIGGQRRAAGLALMNVRHPDILKFINAKLVDKLIPHYNISVGVTEDFLQRVESNNMWDLKFAQKTYDTIDARTLWDTLISNMLTSAEPGLINWDNLRENNSYFYAPVITTNPCGEAILSPYETCCLGSIVLPKFVGKGGNTNWIKIQATIENSVRFLDDVIDCNNYVLDVIKTKSFDSRRIGLGYMGLADYLFAKKLRYGSTKALEETEKLAKFVRNCVYESLVKLSSEKGAFPKFDSTAYSKAKFIRTLPPSLRMDIKKYGSRCVTGISIAPTGTISLIAGVSSGIEPLFLKAYERKDQISNRIYIHDLYKQALKDNTDDIDEWFVDTSDLKPEDHLETQSIVQKYVDGGVSKTINFQEDISHEKLSSLLLEYIRDLKGVTIYVDGSREGQILNKISKEKIKEFLKKEQFDSDADIDTVKCSSGSCEL